MLGRPRLSSNDCSSPSGIQEKGASLKQISTRELFLCHGQGANLGLALPTPATAPGEIQGRGRNTLRENAGNTLSCSSFSLPPSLNAVNPHINYLCFLTDTSAPRLRHLKLFCMGQEAKGSSSSHDHEEVTYGNATATSAWQPRARVGSTPCTFWIHENIPGDVALSWWSTKPRAWGVTVWFNHTHFC